MLLVAVLVAVSFWAVFNRYLLYRQQQQLRQASSAVANLLAREVPMPFEGYLTALTSHLAWRLADIHVISLGLDRRIRSSTLPEHFVPNDQLAERIWRRLMGGRHTVLDYREDRFLYAVSPVIRQGTTVGYVMALTSFDDLRYLGRRAVTLLLVVLVIVGLVGILFAAYFTHKIADPLNSLASCARKIARREFRDCTAELQQIESDDEIGELARSFLSMTMQLEDYHYAQLRFIQNASHELKSPLMNIQGYAEGLQEGLFTPAEAERGLEVIVEEAARLKKIVDELLYLSKVEANDSDLQLEQLNAVDIVQAACQSIYARAALKNLQLEASVSDDITLTGHYDSLVRALSNVVANAVRFAESIIEIEAAITNGCVRFTVRDDGPGFTAEDLPHVFERFYKGKCGETGLGLAITKAIIEQHGGSVSAANRIDGKGAEIHILLPRA